MQDGVQQMTTEVNQCTGDCFLREPYSLAELHSDARRCRGLLEIGKIDFKAFVVEGGFPIGHRCIIGLPF